MSQKLISFSAIFLLQIANTAFLPGLAAAGENLTEDQIVEALTAKKEVSRQLVNRPRVDTAAESVFLERIRGLERVLTPEEREEAAVIAKDKPQIDLEITFEYNSAEINSKSLPSVQALGRALNTPDLKGSTFLVAGHTDAAGRDSYNQDLSERRAVSIKRYVVEKFGIPSAGLVTVGYGKTKLKDPAHPFADVNRRVQVSNMSGAMAASK
ncbi:OmpA family protein [Bradyrhizobium jicamae]|uniref:OmpA family protein n=1 Tax=Bradyrhizobium jicamae TaxID=280332 RepID=A0ABS5FV42_9BRAD|nr:OmpA family protein [Bradyrhizobium jicamae]MBR0800705.1 OmpA family protein [Bradyrhizobium jicamae]MBR0936626.1 OmpA family protein [Bradyrhizobium jicamae]